MITYKGQPKAYLYYRAIRGNTFGYQESAHEVSTHYKGWFLPGHHLQIQVVGLIRSSGRVSGSFEVISTSIVDYLSNIHDNGTLQ